MKTAWRSILLVVALALTGAVHAANVSFGQVVDGVDPQKNTKLAAKEYWNTMKGQEVSWSGALVEIDGSSKKARLYVADKSRPLYKGFNIIVETLDTAKAQSLKKGQTVRFRGLLHKYNQKDNGAVITLIEASLL